MPDYACVRPGGVSGLRVERRGSAYGCVGHVDVERVCRDGLVHRVVRGRDITCGQMLKLEMVSIRGRTVAHRGGDDRLGPERALLGERVHVVAVVIDDLPRVGLRTVAQQRVCGLS